MSAATDNYETFIGHFLRCPPETAADTTEKKGKQKSQTLDTAMVIILRPHPVSRLAQDVKVLQNIVADTYNHKQQKRTEQQVTTIKHQLSLGPDRTIFSRLCPSEVKH